MNSSHLLNGFLIILVTGIVLLKIITLLNSKHNRQSKAAFDKTDIIRKPIINKSEAKFFSMLIEAFPEYYVFTQVSFSALVTHANKVKDYAQRNNVRNKFNRKAVDFVLCSKDFEVIAIIEYDGRGHSYKHDDLRDTLLKSADYRVERFNESDDLNSIKRRFHSAQGNTHPDLHRAAPKLESAQF